MIVLHRGVIVLGKNLYVIFFNHHVLNINVIINRNLLVAKRRQTWNITTRKPCRECSCTNFFFRKQIYNADKLVIEIVFTSIPSSIRKNIVIEITNFWKFIYSFKMCLQTMQCKCKKSRVKGFRQEIIKIKITVHVCPVFIGRIRIAI